MAGNDSIVVDYSFAAPPEQVWRALTEPELVKKWLMETDLKPVVGHRFTFRATPMPGWNGIVESEVLEADPPRRLAYTWVNEGVPSTVTWELEKDGQGGTRVRLVHSGLVAGEMSFKMLSQGWNSKGEKIAEAIREAAA